MRPGDKKDFIFIPKTGFIEITVEEKKKQTSDSFPKRKSSDVTDADIEMIIKLDQQYPGGTFFKNGDRWEVKYKPEGY
ncbi:hypothetical protein [Neobacillus sp. 19]|uniref:hypothetical protein n=1 Tax=Neobacillus sp. 19 TaxID=3394458 RepID=UPI003BF663C7